MFVPAHNNSLPRSIERGPVEARLLALHLMGLGLPRSIERGPVKAPHQEGRTGPPRLCHWSFAVR